MIVDKDGRIAFNKQEENYLIKKLANMMKALIYFEAEHNAKKFLKDLKHKSENHYFCTDDNISIPYTISFNGQTLVSWVAERECETNGENENFASALVEIEALRRMADKKKSKWWKFSRGK
jgi:hypothetical protein